MCCGLPKLGNATTFQDQLVFLVALTVQMTLQLSSLFPLDFVSETALPCTAKGAEPQGFQVLALKVKCHGVFLLYMRLSSPAEQNLIGTFYHLMSS